jgi:hypothetical protein
MASIKRFLLIAVFIWYVYKWTYETEPLQTNPEMPEVNNSA